MISKKTKKIMVWWGTVFAGAIASVFISDSVGSDWLYIPLSALYGYWHAKNIESIYKYLGLDDESTADQEQGE